MEFFTLAEADEAHALGIAAGHADLAHPGADALAAAGHEHDFVCLAHAEGADHVTGFVGNFHRDDAFATAPLQTVFVKFGAFAHPVGSGHEEGGVRDNQCGPDDEVTFGRTDAPDSGRGATHVTDAVLAETDAHAVLGDKDNFVVSVGHERGNQFVTILDVDRDDAALADVAVGGKVALLDHAGLGREKDVLVLVPRLVLARAQLRLDAHDGGNFLAGFELEEVGDGAAFGRAAHFGDVVGFFDVAASFFGEEDEVVVRARGKEVFDEIVLRVFRVGFAGLHADDTFAAAFLGAIGADRGAFDETAVGHGDDAAFVGDEILDVHLTFVGHDVGQPGVGVFRLDLAQFAFDDVEDAFLAGDDVEQVLDGGKEGLVFAEHLVALQAGQLVEAEFEDVVDLLFGQ